MISVQYSIAPARLDGMTGHEEAGMAGTGQSARKLTMDDIRAAAERLKNWGRWGANDEIGTLNFTRPEDIVAAAQLVRKGRVISLALPYDQN
jgi:hypothetical protein